MARNLSPTVKNLALSIVLITVLGLIAVPALPWYSQEMRVDTEHAIDYVDAGDISQQAQSSPSSAVQSIKSDLSWIKVLYWVALVFAFVALVGVMVLLSGSYQAVAHTLLVVGSFALIFGILAFVTHLLFIAHVADLEAEMNDMLGEYIDGDFKMRFFNYFSFVTALLLMVECIVLMPLVGMQATSWLRERAPAPGAQVALPSTGYDAYYYQPPMYSQPYQSAPQPYQPPHYPHRPYLQPQPQTGTLHAPLAEKDKSRSEQRGESLKDKLVALKELRDEGLISEEDYNEKRREILKEM